MSSVISRTLMAMSFQESALKYISQKPNSENLEERL